MTARRVGAETEEATVRRANMETAGRAREGQATVRREETGSEEVTVHRVGAETEEVTARRANMETAGRAREGQATARREETGREEATAHRASTVTEEAATVRRDNTEREEVTARRASTVTGGRAREDRVTVRRDSMVTGGRVPTVTGRSPVRAADIIRMRIKIPGIITGELTAAAAGITAAGRRAASRPTLQTS